MKENLKRVEEIQIIRNLKMDLNNPRYNILKKEEKAIILKSLNDYEHSLINLVTQYNNNVKILNEEGIEAKEVEIPKLKEQTPNYEFADSLILASNKAKSVYLKDTIRIILAGDPSHHNLSEKEFKVLAYALKDYAFNLQIALSKQENNKDLYENTNYESNKISEEEALNILYSNLDSNKKNK